MYKANCLLDDHINNNNNMSYFLSINQMRMKAALITE